MIIKGSPGPSVSLSVVWVGAGRGLRDDRLHSRNLSPGAGKIGPLVKNLMHMHEGLSSVP